MNRRNVKRSIGVAASACVIAAASWAFAGPASGDILNGCPVGGTGNPQTSNLVGASYTTSANTATYYFDSFTDLYDEVANTGVPGLIEYCVYPDPSTQPDSVTIGAGAVGANGALWEDPPAFDNFSIGRPGGNPTNIPLDGTLGRVMGSATWGGGIPASQTILLHINNAAECDALYGGNPGTCFVLPGSPPPPPDPKAALHIRKFYDANANGVFDGTDAYITGWQVTYNSTPTTTPFDSVAMPPGAYTVSEGTPIETNWIHTTATSESFTLADGDNKTVEFGNVCLGAGGGLTLGFWSNKNGQALVNADDLAMLVALNLRNANGTAFDPGTKVALKNWLLAGTATNMAYMLSVQLAAMELNVFNGNVDGGALIYVGSTLGGPAFITINALMTAANTELGLHGSTLAGSPFRSYQEALKNALDRANNNLNFVQGTACPFSFAA